MVESAFTSGETPFFTMPKIFNGKVVLSAPVVKKLMTTSSNDIVNANMPPDMTPGIIIGSVTRINVLNSFAPKSLAASSMEESKPDILERTVITTKGIEKVICDRMSVSIPVSMFSEEKNISNAIPKTISGITIGIYSVLLNNDFNLDSILYNPTAHIVPITTDTKVDTEATIIVFEKALINCLF